jgi:hypothetical protein
MMKDSWQKLSGTMSGLLSRYLRSEDMLAKPSLEKMSMDAQASELESPGKDNGSNRERERFVDGE